MLCVLGRQLESLAPLAFLAADHLLAIVVVSYHGQVTYGLLGDADGVRDLAELAKHLQASPRRARGRRHCLPVREPVVRGRRRPRCGRPRR